MERRLALNKPLALRLRQVHIFSLCGILNYLLFRVGRGALARVGEFWYPVRLIQWVKTGWRVQWWRENKFMSNEGPEKPGLFSVVDSANIVDSLWNDRSNRRTIRVSESFISLLRI
jgi:hypothetical protein